MEKNKISVVIPVYNGANFIGESIESVLNQTYRNIELIIVNDHSTDNTLEIISDYASRDSRIFVINNDTNQKLPRTLNNGFKVANGEYLTWTSDDNIYQPSALARMAEILDNDENIQLVYADFVMEDMDGNFIEHVIEPEPDEIRFRDNIGACFLYRHSLANKAGEYNPEMFLAEDYEFFIRCYKKAKGAFFHLPETLYTYRRHATSLTSTRYNDIVHKTFEVMMLHFDFLYGECNNQQEQNRFLGTLLSLLLNKNERKKYREKFYQLNADFIRYDRKTRIIGKLRSIVALPYRMLSRKAF